MTAVIIVLRFAQMEFLKKMEFFLTTHTVIVLFHLQNWPMDNHVNTSKRIVMMENRQIVMAMESVFDYRIRLKSPVLAR